MSERVKLLRLGGTSGGTLPLLRLASLEPADPPLAIPLGGRAGGSLLLTPPGFPDPLSNLCGKIGEFVASWEAVTDLVFNVPVLLTGAFESCNIILSFPSWDSNWTLWSSNIFILVSNLPLCSLNILASWRISASDGTDPTLLLPKVLDRPLVLEAEWGPLPVELEDEAFKTWYSSCKLAFSFSSSLWCGWIG